MDDHGEYLALLDEHRALLVEALTRHDRWSRELGPWPWLAAYHDRVVRSALDRAVPELTQAHRVGSHRFSFTFPT